MSQSVSRRNLLFATAGLPFAGLPFLGSASAAMHPTPITIANAAGELSQTMDALMRQEGFFESFGVAPRVLDVSDGSRLVGAVVSNSIDLAGTSGFGQVFPAIEHGASIKVLAGSLLSTMLALFSSKPQIKTLKDLEGKTIGTGSVGALVYQLTVTLLRKYQVDVSNIRFVNIGSSADVFRAVSIGTIDAGAAQTSLIEQASEYHVHLIEHGNMTVEIPAYTSQGTWASDRKIATKRDAIVRTLAAYASLYRFVQSPRSQEAFLRARRSVFSTASERDNEAEWHAIQRYKPFAVDLVLSAERLRYIQELNVDFKVQQRILPFERVADMSLATDALKLVAAKASAVR